MLKVPGSCVRSVIKRFTAVSRENTEEMRDVNERHNTRGRIRHTTLS